MARDSGRAEGSTIDATGKKSARAGRRLMAALVSLIAILVVGTLFFYGLRKPEQGPGNVPAQGEAPPLRDNGSPPASK